MKKFNIYWLYLIILVVLGGIFFMHDDSQTKDVSWTEFEGYVVKGGVKNIVVYADKRQAEGEDARPYPHQCSFRQGSGRHDHFLLE